MTSINWDAIAETVAGAEPGFTVKSTAAIGGGCINRAFRLEGNNGTYFVKTNRAALADMFEAEAAGLNEMAQTETVRVPRPVGTGIAGGSAYLVLEWISLGRGGRQADRLLGTQLARMHRVRQGYFGWQRDNTIGSTPQKNPRTDDWCEFWKRWRLGFQLELAAQNGYGRLMRTGEALMSRLPGLFAGHNPQPSLLHGDLWGGNASGGADGQPVIFDPASYYGDREADIAMTELFGGFGADFYAAYNESWPLDSGYAVRKVLYNLYHILNHLNLFGGGYLGQAESMIDRLLAEVR